MSYFVQKQSRCTTNAFYSVSRFWKLTLRSRSVPSVSAFPLALSSMLLPRTSALNNKSWHVRLCSVYLPYLKLASYILLPNSFHCLYFERGFWSGRMEPLPLFFISFHLSYCGARATMRKRMNAAAVPRLLFNYLWWHFHNPICNYFCPAIRTPIYVVFSSKTPKLTLPLSFFSALFL